MAGQTAKPVSTKPVIYISYSHRDEPEHPAADEVKWLSYVLYHLAPAVKHGVFDLWVDDEISAGEDWREAITAMLNACDICILLVSPNSLASDYIIGVEVETIKQRQEQEDVPLFPIVLKPIVKNAARWLMEYNLRPTGGRSLSEFAPKERDEQMVAIVDEIVVIVEEIAEKKKAAVAAALQKADLGSAEFKGEGYIALDLKKVLTLDITRLPETAYERLVGREEQLKRLDEAWMNPAVSVFSLVAEGGAGKSALVNEWLKRILRAENYRGADAVFGWSFYSQGSKERATSADQFLDWALDKLGIKLDPTSASAKCEAIAEGLAKRRVLLVLDGIDAFQNRSGPHTGELTDAALWMLLVRFATVATTNAHGLIVITSRLAVADISRWKHTCAPVLEIESLSVEAGAALLRDNGVWGDDVERAAAAGEFGGHPLALLLLAIFLKESCYGDVRQRDRIRKPAQREFFVSYAWGDETPEGRSRAEIVDRLCASAERRGIRILRDKIVLHLGDRISSFIRRLGSGDRVFVVLSDKYLKSAYCMNELLQVWRNSRQDDVEFLSRIRVYALPDAKIGTPIDRAQYAVYWKQESARLESYVKEQGMEILALEDFERFKLMKDFTHHVGAILAMVNDVLRPRSFEEFERYGFGEVPSSSGGQEV